jgi:hypothetical protein
MQNFSAQELIKKGMSGTPGDQKIGKIVMGTVVVGIILIALYYLLPFITPIFQNIETIASSLVKTIIYVLIGIILIVFAKKQVRNLDYLSDMLARMVFNGIITYDPFLIQEKQINQAEHDVEKMMNEKTVIDGKWTELNTKLKKYNNDFQAAGLTAKELTLEAQKTTDPKRLQLLKLDIDDSIRKRLLVRNILIVFRL